MGRWVSLPAPSNLQSDGEVSEPACFQPPSVWWGGEWTCSLPVTFTPICRGEWACPLPVTFTPIYRGEWACLLPVTFSLVRRWVSLPAPETFTPICTGGWACPLPVRLTDYFENKAIQCGNTTFAWCQLLVLAVQYYFLSDPKFSDLTRYMIMPGYSTRWFRYHFFVAWQNFLY